MANLIRAPLSLDADAKLHRRKLALASHSTQDDLTEHKALLGAHRDRAILYGTAGDVALNTTTAFLSFYTYSDVQGNFDANAFLGEITVQSEGVFDIGGSINGVRTGSNVGQEIELILRIAYGDPITNLDAVIGVLQVAVHSSGRLSFPFFLTTWLLAGDKLSIGLKATADMGTYSPDACSLGIYQFSRQLPAGTTR